ncbi:hypothetical protein X777_11773 [Ooceraea biroi]|uniref:Uncharacterized protein n=1 Tax=Ooceraea biroi TaxID=2015173 RepID=A0A026W0U0_OOCBI|nr:hypothetical protein X777_11773 [Ooceraea biroi]
MHVQLTNIHPVNKTPRTLSKMGSTRRAVIASVEDSRKNGILIGRGVAPTIPPLLGAAAAAMKTEEHRLF